MIHNLTLLLSKALKRKLFFVPAIMDSISVRKISESSKLSLKAFDSMQLNSIFAASVKPYINFSKINLLHKYFEPTNILRCTYSFVVDEDIAKDMVKKFFSNTKYSESIILEANPGLGLITLNLINAGALNVHVCDASQLQPVSLQQILKKYPDKLTLNKHNILKNSDFLILSSFDEAEKQNLCVKIIAVSTSFYFLRLLVVIFFKNGLWKNKFEIYLVLSSAVFNSLNSFNAIHFKFLYYCAFNLLFNIEKIGSYPCKAFLPVCKGVEDNFDFVKISLNPNLFENLDENELTDYIIFITILGSSSYNLIIPTLEKWLPDCGPYLIAKGISLSNTIRDISPQESITLFKIFKECEGYNNFKVIINNAFEGSVIVN